jgi:hypothetical protein
MTRAIAVLGTTALLSVGFTAGSASAAVVTGTCWADGDRFDVSLRYTEWDSDEWFVDYMSFVVVFNDDNQNNVILRVQDTTGFTWWAWVSGDNIVGGQGYRREVDRAVLKSRTTYGYGWVNADQPIDSTCSLRTSTF